MTEINPSQKCPICGEVQPLSAERCALCGAQLSGEPAPVAPVPSTRTDVTRGFNVQYDPGTGDDDLYADDLAGRMWRLILIVGVVLALVAGIGIGALIAGRGDRGREPGVNAERIEDGRPTVPPTATARQPGGASAGGETRQPTLALATVTPAPPTRSPTPTPTETPTPGPCIQTAREGDTIYGMAIRCGHQDMGIVDLILELNNMNSPTELQLNQSLEIPWPTPTPGAEPPTEAPEGAADAPASNDVAAGDSAVDSAPTDAVNEFGTPDKLATYQSAEPTLRPGQAWHVVQAGETILSISQMYDAGLETLSQINPEVAFLQCDYGSPTGGPNCTVLLSVGQRIRVPVPLPTATPTSTPAGTLTPTPSLTPTFNAPYPVTPYDGTHFNADQLVTLRWGGTGRLAENERYLVRVRDLDTGEDYSAPVNETSYILPGGWQPDDRNRHTFEWTVSIARLDEQMSIVAENHVTEARKFTWDSR